MTRMLGLSLIVCLAACGSTPKAPLANETSTTQASSSGAQPEADAGEDGAAVPDAGGSASCPTGAQVVTFNTADDVRLEADYVPSGTVGGKAAVLLHMIPPSNDRTNYPPAFVEALSEAGYTVLNVDRRGAGNSAGTAKDAYEGPAGKEDALAAVAFLGSSACAVPPGEIVVFGASNGTTTALDYAVVAPTRPKALVFLSPGGYTENQTTVAEHRELLGAMPVFLGYPDSERTWPQAQREHAGEGWVFEQYDGGGHGTRLFESSPQVTADLLAFLAGLP